MSTRLFSGKLFYRLAQWVSRTLDPFVLFIFLMTTAALRGGVVGWDLVVTELLLFVGMIIPPMLLLLWAVKAKKVTNWDISYRPQRVKAFIVFSVFLLFDLFIVRSFHNEDISQLFSFLLVSFLGVFCITLFWKISGHVTFLALSMGLIVHWYGGKWSVLAALIPLLMWSRVFLKRHTVAQTIGGAVYGLSAVYIGWVVGLI